MVVRRTSQSAVLRGRDKREGLAKHRQIIRDLRQHESAVEQRAAAAAAARGVDEEIKQRWARLEKSAESHEAKLQRERRQQQPRRPATAGSAAAGSAFPEEEEEEAAGAHVPPEVMQAMLRTPSRAMSPEGPRPDAALRR